MSILAKLPTVLCSQRALYFPVYKCLAHLQVLKFCLLYWSVNLLRVVTVPGLLNYFISNIKVPNTW